VEISVEIFGQLLPGTERLRTLNLDFPVTARDVANTLGLEPTEVGMIVIDHVQCGFDTRLTPGCRLCFFPPMMGG
jgi:hypothetical protein